MYVVSLTLRSFRMLQGLEDTGDKKLTYRETRFNQFASVEYDGNIYMTPQDFLESVTLETPRGECGMHAC